MTAEIHPIETERDRRAEACVDDLKEQAAQIAEARKGDIGGYAIVAWGERGNYSVQTRVWSGAVPRPLVPTFVEEAVRQNLITNTVASALAGSDDGTGGAA